MALPLAAVDAKSFDQPLPQSILNIEVKGRSNLFAWRGQFSPQLVESLLRAYCPGEGTVLDPFSGSGTVLYEAGCLDIAAYGFEVNPAAWILSRVYQFINKTKDQRREVIESVKQRLGDEYPAVDVFYTLNNTEIPLNSLAAFLKIANRHCTVEELTFIEAMVILLDLYNKRLTAKLLYDFFYRLSDLVMRLPYSAAPIATQLADARSLPLGDQTVDFILTSPPYINVFNYHQNYRCSTELLGWDLLKVAKSEIGSNRANRGNRFLTVIQYCIDMASVLRELYRVCKKSARVLFVVGHESKVLGVPFYNADLIEHIAQETESFVLQQRQQREFRNKFGQIIREDLLHFSPVGVEATAKRVEEVARQVALTALANGMEQVSEKNQVALVEAMKKANELYGTPVLVMGGKEQRLSTYDFLTR